MLFGVSLVSLLLVTAILYQTASAEPKVQCGRRLVRTGRIVGGNDAFDGEFPWTVSIRLLSSHLCGGAIVNKLWILTAAHCVKRYSARHFRVRMGEYDVTEEESHPIVDIRVHNVIVHPKFGKPGRYSNDLALIKLRRPMVYDEYALPVCLPEAEDDIIGRNATVVGWGWLSENTEKGKAKRLQKVQVPVLDNSVCQKWYTEAQGFPFMIHDNQICAGYREGERDSCKGDSGGPLVLRDDDHYTIIGVVSAGLGCARKLLPGVYTRVASFLPWIQNVTHTF